VDLHAEQQMEIIKAKNFATNKPKDNLEWSGQDIMMRLDPYKARYAISKLNAIRIWPYGVIGFIVRCRVLLKSVMMSTIVDNILTALVFFNTIILALDRYNLPKSEDILYTSLNSFFTIAFAVEMFAKIIAIGIAKYMSDKLNWMDGAISIMSLVEMIFLSGNGALSAFRSVRMLRTFRVLRVARLLRGLKSMMNILTVIVRSIGSFMYLGILLFLFIFIYALLGMQLFGGEFGFLTQPRYNFDTFQQAFTLSFDLLSGENWNNSLFNGMNSSANHYLTAIYFITAILIGNQTLLSLFLAIVLDSFSSVDEESHDTQEKRDAKLKKDKDDLKHKQGDDLVYGLEEIDEALLNEGGKMKKKKKKKKSTKKVINYLLDESIEIDAEELELEKIFLATPVEPFTECHCELSIFIFKKVCSFS
jgi:hypothetical protein